MDGHAGTAAMACSGPHNSATSPDCFDTNPNVFPRQTEYFASSYCPGGGVRCFDRSASMLGNSACGVRMSGSNECATVLGTRS